VVDGIEEKRSLDGMMINRRW